MTRSYSELKEFSTLEDRFRYLSLQGDVGERTFGSERFLNQRFYTSSDWRRARDLVIARDEGRDLGIEGHEIYDAIYIHHLNPIRPDDIKNYSPSLLDPENLICCSHRTHNAIHYGDESHLPQPLVVRRPGDNKLW